MKFLIIVIKGLVAYDDVNDKEIKHSFYYLHFLMKIYSYRWCFCLHIFRFVIIISVYYSFVLYNRILLVICVLLILYTHRKQLRHFKNNLITQISIS